MKSHRSPGRRTKCHRPPGARRVVSQTSGFGLEALRDVERSLRSGPKMGSARNQSASCFASGTKSSARVLTESSEARGLGSLARRFAPRRQRRGDLRDTYSRGIAFVTARARDASACCNGLARDTSRKAAKLTASLDGRTARGPVGRTARCVWPVLSVDRRVAPGTGGLPWSTRPASG